MNKDAIIAIPKKHTARVFFGCALLALAFFYAPYVQAQSWKDLGTTSGTLTSGRLCRTNGTDILCDTSSPFVSSGAVGIGTSSVAASALLDIVSTTQGLLPPRMTSTQRDAISSPATGLTVYNTTTNALNVYNGTSWTAAGSATPSGSAGYIQFSNGTALASDNATGGHFFWDSTNHRLGIGTTTPTEAIETTGSVKLISQKFVPQTGLAAPASATGGSIGTLTANYVCKSNAAGSQVECITATTGSGSAVQATSPTIATPTLSTSFTSPLHIGGTGTTSTLTLRSTSGVGTTGADIIFQTGNNGATEAMRILNSGNVGIGTTSPNTKLEVNGGAVYVNNGSSTSQLIMGANTTTSGGGLNWDNNNTKLSLQVANSNRMTLDSSGNVGIGTTAPLYTTANRTVLNVNGTSTSLVALSAGGALANSSYLYYDGTNLSVSNNTVGGIINFTTSAATGMTILNGGNVGIGTASPAWKLHISDGIAPVIQLAEGDTGGNAFIGVDANNLFFRRGTIGTADAMTITSTGNVGIGTTSPSYKIDVVGQSRIGNNVTPASPGSTDVLSTAHTILGGYGGNYLTFGQYGASNTYAQWVQSSFSNPTTATYNLILQPLGGNVGIGSTTPSAKLVIVGDTYSNNYYHNSDRRLKNDITPVAGLDLVEKLNGVRFKWKKDGKLSAGVIAQDTESVMPEAVATDNEGMKLVSYDTLIAPLIEAVKDLKRLFDKLSQAINNLTARVNMCEDNTRDLRLLRQEFEAYKAAHPR